MSGCDFGFSLVPALDGATAGALPVIRPAAEPPLMSDRNTHLRKLKAQVRSRVEHPFDVGKNIFKYKKMRYKGLAKNDAQLNVLFAFSNLYMVRGELRP